MERQRGIGSIDESLVLRISSLSPGGQRWLRTALYTIATSEILEDIEEPRVRPPAKRERAPEPIEEPLPPASLEDVITGKADLREHLDAYPDLQDELEGMADIIDLLREAGETRRKRGEQILREDILGGPATNDDDAGLDEEDELT
jgi:hypothetical protein